MRKLSVLIAMLATACGGLDAEVETLDSASDCVFCDGRADAFGISRHSYLAYGIVNLANSASEHVLDTDVELDARAARGIVAQRPFAFVEEVDAVPYVGRLAFTKLAAYVQAHNLMPFCGDGVTQSLIESCDDGNTIDGDGCSATCQMDSTNSAVLANQPLLISGAEIGVPQVDAQAFYFRNRTYKQIYSNPELSFPASSSLRAILRRADSIQAGSGEDGVVGWDDLAIMSKSPFYDVLLEDEKVALEHVWEVFKISDAPIVEMRYLGPSIANTIPMSVEIVRPGPLAVPEVLPISQVDFSSIARRIQGVAALNADGDASTVHLVDVLQALEHYQPVFTSYEITQLDGLRDEFFAGSAPDQGGEFVVEFAARPDEGIKIHPITTFDGWDFSYETLHTVRYTAEDSTNSYWPSATGRLLQQYTRRTTLTRHGQSRFDCESGAFSSCDTNFRYSGVRFYKLDGRVSVAGEITGLMVMELWEDGMRTYNRVLDFKHKMHNVAAIPKKYNEYFAATPMLGQSVLSLQREGENFTLTSGSGVQASMEAMLPRYTSEVRERLSAGRYEVFEGVILDVHKSGAVVAYFDGCEFPTTISSTYLTTEVCPSSGRSVRVYFADQKTMLLVDGGSVRKSVEINSPYGGGIGLDKSYYVTR